MVKGGLVVGVDLDTVFLLLLFFKWQSIFFEPNFFFMFRALLVSCQLLVVAVRY